MRLWKRLKNPQSLLFGKRTIEDVRPSELAAALQITENARRHGHPNAVLKVRDGEGWVVYDEWLDRQASAS